MPPPVSHLLVSAQVLEAGGVIIGHAASSTLRSQGHAFSPQPSRSPQASPSRYPKQRTSPSTSTRGDRFADLRER
jgi:hypothetical protein